jgi:hypothetical protein
VLHVPSEGAIGFIEYIPGRYTWRPIEAPGWMVIHCLMIHKKKYKGKGYGSLLVKDCVEETKNAKHNGVAVVTSEGTWMAGKELFLKNGFESVDEAPPSFALLVKQLKKSSLPRFQGGYEEKASGHGKGLVIIRSDQCPCIAKFTQDILEGAKGFGLKPKVVELKNAKAAQSAPSPYGIFNILYQGKLIADHPISRTRFIRIMEKELQ